MSDKTFEVVFYCAIIALILCAAALMIYVTRPADCPPGSETTYTRSGWFCTVPEMKR